MNTAAETLAKDARQRYRALICAAGRGEPIDKNELQVTMRILGERSSMFSEKVQRVEERYKWAEQLETAHKAEKGLEAARNHAKAARDAAAKIRDELEPRVCKAEAAALAAASAYQTLRAKANTSRVIRKLQLGAASEDRQKAVALRHALNDIRETGSDADVKVAEQAVAAAEAALLNPCSISV